MDIFNSFKRPKQKYNQTPLISISLGAYKRQVAAEAVLADIRTDAGDWNAGEGEAANVA
jgi:hypothetical protein